MIPTQENIISITLFQINPEYESLFFRTFRSFFQQKFINEALVRQILFKPEENSYIVINMWDTHHIENIIASTLSSPIAKIPHPLRYAKNMNIYTIQYEGSFPTLQEAQEKLREYQQYHHIRE